MEPVTAQEILDVFGILVDQRDSTGSFATDGEIPLANAYSLLNLAVQDVARTIVQCNDDYYLDKFESNIVAGQREYTMPTNLRNTQKVEIDYSGTGNSFVGSREVRIKDLENTSKADDNFSQEYPAHYFRGLQTIGFIPIPTTSAAKCIRIWAIALPNKVSSLTATVRIPREAIEAVAYKMASVVKNDAGYKETAKELKRELEILIKPRGEISELLDQSDPMYSEDYNSYEDEQYIRYS